MARKPKAPDPALPPALRPEAVALLDCAEAAIRHLDPNADRWDNSVGFRSDAGYTVLRVHPVNEVTNRGEIIGEWLMLHTALPAGTPLTDSELLKANLLAGIGAVVREPGTGALAVLSSAAILAGDDPSLRLLGGLFLRSAPDHGAGVAALFVDEPRGKSTDGTRPWQLGEFAAARDALLARGIPVELTPGQLKARLPSGPVVPEPLAAIFPPSRLVLSTHEPHPWLGRGLCAILELPACCAPEEAERLVNTLNGWEWSTPGTVPFIGAWTCLPGKSQPAFVTFVTDEAWHPQLVGSLCEWAVRRAGVARGWILNSWEKEPKQ